MKTEKIRIRVSDSIGEVSALFIKAQKPRALLVLAHGAGAGMTHPFMLQLAVILAENGVSTLRYQFPYMEKGKKRPDPPTIATATVKAAVMEGRKHAGDQILLAGGKSFGGRMTSQAAADDKIDVDGIVFFGFPLHAPGKASDHRAEHLLKIDTPTLFLQGTRDSLANLDLISSVIEKIGKTAHLQILQGGDHSFKTRKMDGISEDEVYKWLADSVLAFLEDIIEH